MESDKKISVIIPAYNESKYIEAALKKWREQDYDNFEIIVVDNSDDNGKTYEAAKPLADKIIKFSGPIGLSRARNEGAKAATGQILLFCDADSWLERRAIKTLVLEFDRQNIVGSFWGKDEKESFRGGIFFFFKNWAHLLKIHEGAAAGTIFCSKDVFLKTEGFDAKKEPAELQDFIIKAKKAGAKYKIITSQYAFTSMRRYEKKGYLKIILFWIKWKILNIFSKENDFAKNYYKETKDA